MNLLDVAIVVVLVLLTVRGFLRGIVQEATTLLGVIVSFFLAAYYYRVLAQLLLQYLPGHSWLLHFLSFIFLFVLSIFLFHGLGLVLKKAFHWSLLGWLDRGLGGLLGFLKAGILIFFLITLLTLTLPKTSNLINHSRIFPWVISFADRMTLLIPGKIQEDFDQKKKGFIEYWTGKRDKVKGLQRYPDHESP